MYPFSSNRMRASPEDKTYPEESNLSLLFFNDDTFFSEKCKIVNGEILANFSTTTKRIEWKESKQKKRWEEILREGSNRKTFSQKWIAGNSNFSIILAVKSNASLFLERFPWKVARRFRCGQSSGNHREGIKKEEAFGADKGGSLEKRQWFLLEAVARTVKGNRINARKTSFGLEADPGKPLFSFRESISFE